MQKVALLVRLIQLLSETTLEGINVVPCVAGGAVNAALGGRPSKDIDVFILGKESQREAAATRLLDQGWVRVGPLADYANLWVAEHPHYPGIQVVIGHCTSAPELLESFDIPQHRAAVMPWGTVIDRRSDDWVSGSGQVQTSFGRVHKARSYGYALGPTMNRLLEIEARISGVGSIWESFCVYGAASDFTDCGSVFAMVSVDKEYFPIRVCVDGRVFVGEHKAFFEPAMVRAGHTTLGLEDPGYSQAERLVLSLI